MATRFGGLAEWILREGPDEMTQRFIPTKPGEGKRESNSKLDKWYRRQDRHPATLNRKRKKHGKP